MYLQEVVKWTKSWCKWGFCHIFQRVKSKRAILDNDTCIYIFLKSILVHSAQSVLKGHTVSTVDFYIGNVFGAKHVTLKINRSAITNCCVRVLSSVYVFLFGKKIITQSQIKMLFSLHFARNAKKKKKKGNFFVPSVKLLKSPFGCEPLHCSSTQMLFIL